MPTEAMVFRKVEVGRERVKTTVVSLGASTASRKVRSTEDWAALAVSKVKTTSEAVTASPSVKKASSRRVKVQVRPSSDRL